MRRFLESLEEEWQEMKEKPLGLLGWAVGILTGLWALIAAIVQQIDWRVFSLVEAIMLIVLLVKYQRLKTTSVKLENLYNGNVPMVSTLSYIMNARKRDRYNKLAMHDVTIRYRFNREGGMPGTVKQTVTWDFSGVNNSSRAVTRAIMMVSKSVYSRYNEIELSAVDQMTNRNLTIDRLPVNGAQRYIEIVFDRNGIAPGALFHYQLKMRWVNNYQFTDAEFFIIDPKNYSLNTAMITTIIESDDDYFDGLPVTYLALSRNSFTSYKNDDYNASLEKNSSGIYCCSRTFRPKMTKLYLIRIGN